MHYRSIADLTGTILRNLPAVPADIDLVVGIPRSGLLAANLISMTLDLPLTDLDGLLAGRLLSPARHRQPASTNGTPRHVLVVDDSIRSGSAMRQAREQISNAGVSDRVTYCAIYGNLSARGPADIVLETVPHPRMFEWNVMHHPLLDNAWLDGDGLLWPEPTADDLCGAPEGRALIRPTTQIGCLLTRRAERHRAAMTAWLEREGISCAKLLMSHPADHESAGSRMARAYAQAADASVLISASESRALEVSWFSRRSVLSLESQTMIYPYRPNQAAKTAAPSKRLTDLPRWKRAIVGLIALLGVVGIYDAAANLPVVSGCEFYAECPDQGGAPDR